MRTFTLSLSLSLLCASIMASISIRENVYNVTDDNFEEFMDMLREKNGTAYIKFFTPMCPHCQQLRPIYIEAAKQLKDDPDGLYFFAEVNALHSEKLTKHFQIRGFPTILAFSPVNEYVPTHYEKERTAYDMIQYLEMAAGLYMKELQTVEELEFRRARRNESILLGVFSKEASAKSDSLYNQFLKLKEDMGYVRMYYTFAQETFSKGLGIQSPASNYIVLLHNQQFLEPGDVQHLVYDSSKYKTMKNFVIAEYPYDVEIMNDKIERIYSVRPRPRAVLFTQLENRTDIAVSYAKKLKELSRKFPNKFNLYIQNADKQSLRKYKLVGDATFIIFDNDEEKSKYRYTEKVFNGSIDVPALISFSAQFLAKSLPKYIRTAEVNKDDLDEPVYPVLAKTYDEIVKDPKKHVFLRFFDKMIQRFSDQFLMRKEWWKVGKYFANNAKDLLIAEIETNDNDVPEYFLREMQEGHYYFMFTKTNKKNPIVYSGKVNATDLIAFTEDILKKEGAAPGSASVKTDL